MSFHCRTILDIPVAIIVGRAAYARDKLMDVVLVLWMFVVVLGDVVCLVGSCRPLLKQLRDNILNHFCDEANYP